jgi:ectoine/hydroxyectoine ABC transporter solute-binding protein
MTGMDRRRFCQAAGVSALLAGTAPTLLTACSYAADEPSSGGALDRARQRGYINAGISNELPYAYTDKSGRLTGGMAELAKVIFAELGVDEVRPVLLNFAQLIAGLVAGRCDTVAAGMFITPERCALVTFANPDFCAKTAFLVPKGNPAGLHTFEDVAKQPKLRLGVLAGAVEVGQAVAAGVPKSRIIRTFTDQSSAFQALEAGRIQAISLTRISLAHLLDTHEDAPYEVTAPFIPRIDGKESIGCGAFAFRNEDRDLVRAWNGKLAEMKSNGRLLRITGRFGFTEAELPGNRTSTDACSPPSPSGS